VSPVSRGRGPVSPSPPPVVAAMTVSVARAGEEITRRTAEGEFGHPPDIDIDLRDRAWMEIFARELSNRHPLNIEECGANDVANEDVKLRACESTFGDFLCKTLSAGKRALDAVKDFDERNQMTVKTALRDFKRNVKALDDKFQFTANVKRFDENTGVTKGVKKTVATINARAKEIDRSLKISATTNVVVGMGKGTAGMVLNKAMGSEVIRKTATALSDLNTSATLKMQDVAAKSKVNSGEVVRTQAEGGPEYAPADRSQTRDAAEERQRARTRASKRPREANAMSDPGNWTDEKAKRIAKDWLN